MVDVIVIVQGGKQNHAVERNHLRICSLKVLRRFRINPQRIA